MGVCIEVCIGVCIGGVKHAPLHEFLTRLFLETTIIYIYMYTYIYIGFDTVVISYIIFPHSLH